MNRLRSNHYSLGESLYRKNIINSQRCKCGYNEENIEHVILDCPLYNEERLTLHKKFKKNKSTLPIDIVKILKTPNSIEAKFISEFLNSCHLSV